MPKIYYETDCDVNVLKRETITAIGYGSQGHVHALNLHDSGVDVIVGFYEGSESIKRVKEAGLEVLTVLEATKAVDIIMILTPDERQAEMYKKDVRPNLTDGKAATFVHGFNTHFGQIKSPKFADVFIIAPKGPGCTVRSEFQEGKSASCLVTVEQDYTGHTSGVVLAYDAGIGNARVAVMETIFHVETEADLLDRQAVLYSDICALMKTGFGTLAEVGYVSENAYFERIHEIKLVVDLTYKGGFELMRYSASDTTEFGDHESGKRLITDDTKKETKQIPLEIQDSTFADKQAAENGNDRAYLGAMRHIGFECQLESVGKELRKMYSWSEEDKYADQSRQSDLTNNAVQYR